MQESLVEGGSAHCSCALSASQAHGLVRLSQIRRRSEGRLPSEGRSTRAACIRSRMVESRHLAHIPRKEENPRNGDLCAHRRAIL